MGCFLTGYSKLSNGDDQTVVTKDANLSDLNTLEEDFPVFVVDYCSIDTTCLTNLVNENLILLDSSEILKLIILLIIVLGLI